MKYFSLHTTAHIISLATAENSDMEFHKKELQRHCRVCAGLLDKKYAYTCQEQTNKLLLQKLGIDVDEDQPDVQPKLFCQSCRTKATQYSETVKSSLVVFEWQSHSDPGSSCEICCFFKKQEKGRETKEGKEESWTATVSLGPIYYEQVLAFDTTFIQSVIYSVSFSILAVDNSSTQ